MRIALGSIRLWYLLQVLLVGVLVAGVPALAGGAPTGAERVLRVLPLGDSITAGANAGDGYRGKLAELAARDRLPIEFVGSLHNPGSDLAHEGHSGFRIDQLDAVLDGVLSSQRPDVVLLHIGSNDLGQGHLVDTAPQRLHDLGRRICTLAPAADLLIASVVDIRGMEPTVARFNLQVPGIVAGLQTEGCRAHFVDANPHVPVTDLVDGVHPDAAGYGQMADAWYPQLEHVTTGASAQVAPVAMNDDVFYYTGSWQQDLHRPAEYWSDRHVSSNAGDTAVFGYQGGLVLRGTRCPACGIAAVSVDGGPDTMVNLYAPVEQAQADVFGRLEVDATQHVVQVRVTGRSDRASTGAAVALDRVDLLPPDPGPAASGPNGLAGPVARTAFTPR